MKLLTIAASRRGKFLVVVFWVVLFVAVIASGAVEKFESGQRNDSASYLPAAAESLRAIELEERMPGGELVPGLVVFRRDAGLTVADKKFVERASKRIAAANDLKLDLQGRPEVGYPPDGKTAVISFAFAATGEGPLLLETADQIRDLTKTDLPQGLVAKVAGGFGFAADAVKVFESMNGFTVWATVSVVALLLLMIYRSPFLLFIPLIAVAFAEVTSRAIGYGLIEAGITVNGQSAIMMTILIFGVGTDYGLLLLARYREELRRHEDRHEAMEFALRRSFAPIVASAATVTIALLCFSIAELNSTAAMGPIGAIGVLVVMSSMLTAFPALLVIVGRRSFFPFVPRFKSADHFASSSFWNRLATFIERRARLVIVGIFALMAVMAIGLTQFNTNLNQLNGFRDDVESVEGQRLLAKALPPGQTGPLSVMATAPIDVDRLHQVVAKTPGVAVAEPPVQANGVVRINAVLTSEPYGAAANATVKRLRANVGDIDSSKVFVGGPAAFDTDQKFYSSRDNKRIIPLVLAVVFIVLMLLLRAVVAPVVLLVTVIASFFAALGVSVVVFDQLFGFAGETAELPLFVFVFLVALGVDYNIFLMARVREEVIKTNAREGMRRGMVATGGVITSAGFVLAGTFSVLSVLPLVMITEVGVAVAIGVLFDALLVRSVLVPAIGSELGEKMWWPSTLSKRPADSADEPAPADPSRESAAVS